MKDKILNFLFIFFFVFLLLNVFNKQQDKEGLQEGLSVKIEKSSYTIPTSINILLENNNSQKIKLNTCESIHILYNGEIQELPKDFCEDYTLQAKEKKTISLGKIYTKFMQTGNYTFDIQIEGKKYVSQIDVSNKGAISKIFVYFFYAPIYNLMVFLTKIFGYSLGWAIIGITIIIRFILIYPQHQMLISQKRMQAIQPKIKEIQEKYKGDSQTLGVELMNLYKKENVNPMGSCGLLLIQMPILLVLYNVVMGVENATNYYYLYSFLKPFTIESIGTNFFGMDLLGKGGTVGIFLALFVGIVQFIQVKLSLSFNKKKDNPLVLEKKKGGDAYTSMMPDAESMNKVMLYVMPVMVGFFTYSLFAGIGIYWGIGTIFGIFQQIIVNKVIKK
ncbi:YidC/Oxa1 family membrane protein insertase [Candidatus Gracilibacteria bacterium]|nr:YidC/Oxa1 family membrane protein insertase [Candidatus Gracilibacteria bacterium]NUJ98748.1 YidC/Oxa1 family membrane protein insertase [Candidatus Gracilibacteria bacterium]